MIRKVTLFLISAFAFFSLFAQTSAPPAVGDGSEANPYEIATLDNLYWLSQNSSEWDKYYIQTSDIDASATSTWDDGDGGLADGFTPVGNNNTPFTGVYKGKNHSVSDLYIYRPTTDTIGLFGNILNASIDSLGLENATITGQIHTGAFVGLINSGSTIIHCYSSGTINGVSATGGLAGTSFAEVSACYSTADINATEHNNGGLIGYCKNATTSKSYSRGSVTAGGNNIGGLIGVNDGGCTVDNCFSTGAVSGGVQDMGGLIGDNGGGTATNCFWDITTSGMTDSWGGTGLSTDDMKDMVNFLNAGWDFVDESLNGNEEYWSFNSAVNDGYPFLNWQGNSREDRLVLLTDSITGITTTGATGYANIVYLGSIDPVAHGMCWNTAEAPTLADNSSDEGPSASTGSYSSAITGLAANTTYFVRAFATDVDGTKYGDEMVFTTYSAPSIGDGSEQNPYEISSLDNLSWLAQTPEVWDKDFIQTADIDAGATSSWNGGEGWSPIGTSDVNFSGSYDGQGHVISNLYVNRPEYFQGFFGYIKNAEIKNLGIENVNINGHKRVGAFAGRSDRSTIEKCFSNGNVTASDDYAGGIVGENYYRSNIINCYSRCNVEATSARGGGITGLNGNECIITNCYSTGSVSGSFYVGGIVGRNNKNVDNCFWDTQTSGITVSDGGTGKTTLEMTAIATFTDTTTDGLAIAWDFIGFPNDDKRTQSTWEIDATKNNGYPVLSWQYPSEPTVIMVSIDTIYQDQAYITCAPTNNGGAEITASGLCWNTTGSPDISDITSDEGSVTGSFTSLMEGLTTENTYYVKAYATNSEGTSYSNEIAFKTTPASGSGTEADPYEISTLEELSWLMGNPRVWDKHFIQTTNINASATSDWFGFKGFSPIGKDIPRKFTGSYHGKNNSISNLYINRPGENAVGFFGATSNADIDSLEIIDIDIIGGNTTGGLAGELYTGSMTECRVSGKISGSTAGGLIGSSLSSTITGCISTCDVTGQNAGGLIVINQSNSVIDDCHATGEVNGQQTTGGLTARNYGVIINSYSTGTVNGDYMNTGGITGILHDDAQIIQSYSSSVVTGDDDYTGGLAGKVEDGCLIKKSYSLGTVSGKNYVGGIAGSTGNNSFVLNCYSHADVTASNYSAGGVVGKNGGTSEIHFCYSSGSVTAAINAGGLVGKNFAGTEDCTNSFWDTQTSGLTVSEGGEGKTTAEMKDIATFTDETTSGLTMAWDFLKNPCDDNQFNDIWHISASINNGYPYFSSDYLAEVTTVTATNVAIDSVTTGGNVISDGGSAVVEKGVCWSMAGPPVSLDSSLAVGSGIGEFSVNINDLDTSTTYYIRAYAVNAVDTSFGNVDTVTTLKATQSIAFATIPEKTYGDSVFTLTASATSGLEVVFSSSDPTIATVSNDSVTIARAGTTTITASQPGNASFSAADDVEQILVINKDTVWVTAHDKSKTYGQTNPELTYNYSDFAYNEDSTVIDTPPVISTTATASTNAGTAEITISGGADDNYTVMHMNGMLTIQKDTVTVTAHDKSREYGSENPEFTMIYSEFISGEDVSVIDQAPSVNTSADTLSDAGTYAIELTGGNDNNYEMELLNGTLTVHKAIIVAKAKNRFRYYGDPNPELPIQFSGFVNNEDTSVIDEMPVASTPATINSDVGSYDIILNGGNDNNYDISLLNGTLTIEKAAQTITFEIPERVPADTGSIELNATASSGEPVEYQISNPSAVSLEGNTLRILSAGVTTITVSQSGNSNYHPTTMDVHLIIDEVTGINNPMRVNRVYPNPVSDILYLEIPGNRNSQKQYQISNILGKVLQMGTLQKNQIDVSGFDPGIYFLIIDDQTIRIIKE